MRVLFWGTPEFATSALRALIGKRHEVVAVVTQPDRPRERGGRNRSTLDASPVKRVAVQAGITVLQPERPRGEDFSAQVRALQPDISVVVAYGHILPREVIDLPRFGTLNIHASLLPLYRGAAPIQAAIRDGRSETGVSIMQMVPALDAGPVILSLTAPILPGETAGELQVRLAERGAEGIIEALTLLDRGQATASAQDSAKATYAPKVNRSQAQVRWIDSPECVGCTIRAFDPRPGAWTTCRGAELRLFGARPANSTGAIAGTILDAEEDGMTVACGAGAVRVHEVHPAGRKRQRAIEWIRGRGAAVGDVLGT